MSTSTTCTAKRMWNAEICICCCARWICYKTLFFDTSNRFESNFHRHSLSSFLLSLCENVLFPSFLWRKKCKQHEKPTDERNICKTLPRCVCALAAFFHTFSFPCASCFISRKKFCFSNTFPFQILENSGIKRVEKIHIFNTFGRNFVVVVVAVVREAMIYIHSPYFAEYFISTSVAQAARVFKNEFWQKLKIEKGRETKQIVSQTKDIFHMTCHEMMIIYQAYGYGWKNWHQLTKYTPLPLA